MARLFFSVAFLGFFAAAPLFASVPADVAERAALIGQPSELVVSPGLQVSLSGPRDVAQLVVIGKYANGQTRDLTAVLDAISSAPDIVNVGEGLFLRGKKNGTTTLILKAGGKTATVAVTVRDFESPKPVSFRNDVIASLNVGGCNMGACHGTPTGKNGFKLSLRGFDPPADHRQLTRDQLGRRIDPWNPDDSLMLRKALGTVPHEGGSRFGATSVPANAMRAWIAAGLPDDSPNLAGVKRLLVRTGPRVLHAPSKVMQVAVSAEFADGTTRDVTRLTNFSSSDTLTANVNGNGRV